MNGKKSFFGKVTDAVNSAINGEDANSEFNAQNEESFQRTNQQHEIYEQFAPKWGLGGRSFAFTENSLIYGNYEYPYSVISNITVVSVPSVPLENGSGEALVNGKRLNLLFEYSQKDRFIKMVNFANQQINLAHGTTIKYKYLIQSTTGTKIEVYDNYVIIYHLKTGLKNLVTNSMRGGASEIIVYFSHLSLQLATSQDGITTYLLVEYSEDAQNKTKLSLPLTPNSIDIAKLSINYIEAVKKIESQNTPEPDTESWKAASGSVRVFHLLDKTLEVPENLDVFNTYRKNFYDIADQCTKAARNEYNKKVQNLSTFLAFFPEIYGVHFGYVSQKAMDIIISEGLWTVTSDTLCDRHTERFHLISDDFTTIGQNIALTLQANHQAISTIMSFVPHLSGGGFGLKGAAKGIATASAFNILRDSVESGLKNSVNNLNQGQQAELFGRINPDNLFERVFYDYWNIYLTLIDILNENGKNIWYPIPSAIERANNIFQNIAHPNFPQDKVLEVMLDIIKTNPYNTLYYRFLTDLYGETDEVMAIRNYFGYTNLNNPRL